MAWHILHGLLEQVRIHSTFPGKLWIVMMFIFRIVVVARIGDNVYHDEQSSFVCNTLSPGCENVCFNKFSPISQLRFWSLMVLVVSSPGILFCLYASHKIYHAYVKFPLSGYDEKAKTWDTNSSGKDSTPFYVNAPVYKRRRTESYNFSDPSASPLFVMRTLNSRKENYSDKSRGKKLSQKNFETTKLGNLSNRHLNQDKTILEKRKMSTSDNNCTSTEELRSRKWQHWPNPMPSQSYPVYADRHGRKIEYVKEARPYDEVRANKESRRMLENPQLYRAYWWHVVIRTLFEIGFLLGQYYLYGFFVPELFECEQWPCSKIVDCFVSRPMEKTCLMWLMFGLGAISCVLSICEFWTLGWERFKYALCCRGHEMTYEEKRRRLAELAKEHKHNEMVTPYQKPLKDEILLVHNSNRVTNRISLDSFSSETSVESV